MRYWKLPFVLVALFAVLVIVVVSISFPQILRSKAFEAKREPRSSVSKLVSLSEELSTRSSAARSARYASEKFGYSLQYDPALWDVHTDSLAEQEDSTVTFTLSHEIGFATVEIDARPLESSSSTVGSEMEQLTKLADDITTKYQSIGSFQKKEETTLAGKQAVSFTLAEQFVGKRIPYEVIVFIDGTSFFQITQRHDVFGPSKKAIDLLVSSLDFGSPARSWVKGLFTSNEKEQQTYETVQLGELVKPSVGSIVYIHCHTISPGSASTFTFLRNSQRYCYQTKGSGVLISPDGKFATNGHVVQASNEEALIKNLFQKELRPLAVSLLQELVYRSSGKTITPSDSEASLDKISENPTSVNAVIAGIYELLDKRELITKTDGELYIVRLGVHPVTVDFAAVARGDLQHAVSLGDGIYQAHLVAAESPNYYSADVVLGKRPPKETDVAVLQLAGKDRVFPAIEFGNAKILKEGSPLLVIGYPALVEGGNADGGGLLSYQLSSARPTLTRGIVSALKYDGQGRLLVQTDASIDRGNSGGPAIDSRGNVVGLATYAFDSTSGNYNFLRDIADVSSLLVQKNIILPIANPTYQAWLAGLAYFWADEYTKALVQFQEVKSLYADHPYVDSYIVDAKKAIATGQDKNFFFGFEIKRVVNGLTITAFALMILYGVSKFISKKYTVVSSMHRNTDS